MKTVELVGGKGTAMVDDEDYEQVYRYSWWLNSPRNSQYAITQITVEGHRKTEMMHRLILQPPDNMVIDHIDGNGLNNQKSNLRLATVQQNAWNYGPRSGRYKGVAYNRQSCKWKASIWDDNTSKTVGQFCTELEAAVAYDKAAFELMGEFAWLNFPPGKVVEPVPVEYRDTFRLTREHARVLNSGIVPDGPDRDRLQAIKNFATKYRVSPGLYGTEDGETWRRIAE
jgi:hypothetical protein